MFRRNRESRTREAAGRRNWPEAVPKKISARKEASTGLSENLLRRCRPEINGKNSSLDAGESQIGVGLGSTQRDSGKRHAKKRECRDWIISARSAKQY